MRYEYTILHILHIHIDIAYTIEDLPMKNTNMPLIYRQYDVSCSDWDISTLINISKYFLTYIIEDLPMWLFNEEHQHATI